ncbi:MAG: shikimate kinase [bacterium]|nr:shikimate kinase [bacterium]
MWTSLIGFMASGKSTVADALQAATNRPVVHLDDVVAAASGRTVAAIFAQDGEAAFRAGELAAIERLDAARHLVLDAGGGIVETPAATALLRERGVVIWLDTPWETLRARLEAGPAGERPLVDALGWDGLESLFRRRRRLYAAAADFRLAATTADPELLARTAMLRSLVWSRRPAGQRR